MESKLTESTENLILVDAQVIYPYYGIRLTLAKPKHDLLQISDVYKICDLMINSSNDNQKAAAQKSLDSIMKALNLKISSLALHQPKQIIAATYARLLQTVSWSGSLFTFSQQELQLINVKAVSGVSEHKHKKYINYTFCSTNKSILRCDVQVTYTPNDAWWYYINLHSTPLSNIPQDFLLWFNSEKKDRGDQDDYPLVRNCLKITNNYLLLTLFYQIKFEIADVVCCPPYFNRLPGNLPANIFERQPKIDKSLTGLMMKYLRLHHLRPNVYQIYQASIQGKLPNSAWNGKWISNHH